MTPEQALIQVRDIINQRHRDDARKPLLVEPELYNYAEVGMCDRMQAEHRPMLTNSDLPMPNFLAFGTWIVMDWQSSLTYGLTI